MMIKLRSYITIIKKVDSFCATIFFWQVGIFWWIGGSINNNQHLFRETLINIKLHAFTLVLFRQPFQFGHSLEIISSIIFPSVVYHVRPIHSATELIRESYQKIIYSLMFFSRKETIFSNNNNSIYYDKISLSLSL